MPRRSGLEQAGVIRDILEAIDLGARTLPRIAEIAGLDRSTCHYYLVRTRGAKGAKTLVQQGLVRAITKHTASRGEGKAAEVFRDFVLTAKGREFLDQG